jgi:hypothetical protein
LVKDVAKALLDGSLPEANYPYIRRADAEPATSGGKGGGAAGGAASARGGRAAGGRAAPRWANKKAGGACGWCRSVAAMPWRLQRVAAKAPPQLQNR